MIEKLIENIENGTFEILVDVLNEVMDESNLYEVYEDTIRGE